MPAILLFCLAFSFASLAAEAAENATFSVQAAFLPQDGDPVVNTAACSIGEPCRILDEKHHDIGLSLEVWETRKRGCLMQKLSLDCGARDCSFKSGRSNMDFGGIRRFSVFEGSENGVETLLVLRTRPKIGSVFLILPKLGPNCLGSETQ